MWIRGKSISLVHTVAVLLVVVVAGKVKFVGTSSAGYYYGKAAAADSSAFAWNSQPYLTQRGSNSGWQNYQQLQPNSGYYNSDPQYTGSFQSSPLAALPYNYWQPQIRRSFQQWSSPYDYPYSNYGYRTPYDQAARYYYPSPDVSLSWRDYLMAQQRRRQDTIMPFLASNYGMSRFPEVTTPAPTTTTTPGPKKPRKSKLFVANVWG